MICNQASEFEQQRIASVLCLCGLLFASLWNTWTISLFPVLPSAKIPFTSFFCQNFFYVRLLANQGAKTSVPVKVMRSSVIETTFLSGEIFTNFVQWKQYIFFSFIIHRKHDSVTGILGLNPYMDRWFRFKPWTCPWRQFPLVVSDLTREHSRRCEGP